MVDVVLADHVVDLEAGDLKTPLPIEGLTQVLLRNVVSVVDVELFEQIPKLLICKCLLHG